MQPNGSYLLTANPLSSLGFSSGSPGVFNSSRFPGGFSRGAFNSSRFPGGFPRGFRGAFNSSTLPGTFNSSRFPGGFSRGAFNSSRFPGGFPRGFRGAFNSSTLPPGGFPRRSRFGNRGSFAAGFSPLNPIHVQGGAYRSKTMKQKRKNKKRGSRRQ